MNDSTVIRIELPEDKSRLFKAYCALHGKTMAEQMTELFLEAIAKDGRIALPSNSVSGAV
jgi:hypothetical protein